MEVTEGFDMLSGQEMTSKVDLPRNTRRVGGLVLSTKARADAVDRSERARAEIGALKVRDGESGRWCSVKFNGVRGEFSDD